MAKETKPHHHSGNVVELPKKCKSDGCTKKDSRFSFCDEHYMWFKEGLITKDGIKVIDFDKKMITLQKRKGHVA